MGIKDSIFFFFKVTLSFCCSITSFTVNLLYSYSATVSGSSLFRHTSNTPRVLPKALYEEAPPEVQPIISFVYHFD